MTGVRSFKGQWALLPGHEGPGAGMRMALGSVAATEACGTGGRALPGARSAIMVEWSDDGRYADRIVAIARTAGRPGATRPSGAESLHRVAPCTLARS